MPISLAQPVLREKENQILVKEKTIKVVPSYVHVSPSSCEKWSSLIGTLGFGNLCDDSICSRGDFVFATEASSLDLENLNGGIGLSQSYKEQLKQPKTAYFRMSKEM
jgi:hypothetical protein